MTQQFHSYLYNKRMETYILTKNDVNVHSSITQNSHRWKCHLRNGYKMWSLHTVGCHSAMEEWSTFPTLWMNLEHLSWVKKASHKRIVLCDSIPEGIFEENYNVIKLNCGDGHTALWVYWDTVNRTLHRAGCVVCELSQCWFQRLFLARGAHTSLGKSLHFWLFL